MQKIHAILILTILLALAPSGANASGNEGKTKESCRLIEQIFEDKSGREDAVKNFRKSKSFEMLPNAAEPNNEEQDKTKLLSVDVTIKDENACINKQERMEVLVKVSTSRGAITRMFFPPCSYRFERWFDREPDLGCIIYSSMCSYHSGRGKLEVSCIAEDGPFIRIFKDIKCPKN
ncbi:hypothetical protein ACFL6Y_04060 [Elusimicrobiota bacterium]